MRTRVLPLILLAALPSFGATPTLVSHADAQANGSSIATTSAINTTGATLLHACVAGFNQPPNAPTDSKGNTWVLIGSVVVQGSQQVAAYYVANPTVGTGHTFTENSGNFPYIAASAWSGVKTTSPLDQHSAGAGAGTQTVQPGSITPTVAGELLLACVGSNNGTAWTINSGFTVYNTIIVGGIRIQAAFLVQTPAVAVNPTWDQGVVGDQSASPLASFFAAADYTISGATTGFTGIASSNVTVTVASGNFPNGCQITQSSSDSGAVFAGGVSGTGSAVFTVSGGATTTYSFTYAGSVAGAATITFSHASCGSYIDPIPITFTVSNPTIVATSFPSSGTKGTISACFNLTLNTGGNFPGAVSITDGGNAGTVTAYSGSGCGTPLGSPGATPYSVPAGGLASVSAKYTAVVIGIMPLTTANSFAYGNATPVNDTVTTTGTAYTATASGNWNVAATWGGSGVPVSGDTWSIPATFTVHISSGYTAISGTCPATRTFADGAIANGGALVVDSGGTLRMQGNIKLNSTAAASTNLPILQYSTGSTVIGDECGGSVPYGPFTVNASGFNAFCVGADCPMVSVAAGANPTVTWQSGQAFNVSTYSGSSWTINGVAYPIASCADTTHCTVTGTPGALTKVYAFVSQPGALTSPPATSITAMNNSNANPVLFNLNGNYDSMLAVIYGAAISNCGSASVPCAAKYLLNNGSLTNFADTFDIENSLLTATGGIADTGVTSNAGTITKLNNVKFVASTGTYDWSEEIGSGAYTNGTICSATNGFFSSQFGNGQQLTGCTNQNLVMAVGGGAANGGTLSSTTSWGTFDSNIIIIPSGGTFAINGPISNTIADYTGTAASSHFLTLPNAINISMAFTGNIFEWDNSTNEGHCYTKSGDYPGTTFTETNDLILPSPVDGGLSCTPWIAVSSSGTANIGSFTITQNTYVGLPVFSSAVSIGHNGLNFPSNVWLNSFKGNITYQSGSASALNSLPIACSQVATGNICPAAPADQAPASVIDYNGLFNQATATLFGSGFCASCPSTSLNSHQQILTTTGTPDTHSVTSNPQFIDATRNLGKWATTQGQANSAAGAIAVFAAANPSTYPALISNALSYIRVGFHPTTVSYATGNPTGGPLGCCGFGVPTGTSIYGPVRFNGPVLVH